LIVFGRPNKGKNASKCSKMLKNAPADPVALPPQAVARSRRRRLLATAAGGCQSNRRRRLRAAEPRSGGAVDNTPLAADAIWRAALAARLRKGAAELARLRPNHPEAGALG